MSTQEHGPIYGPDEHEEFKKAVEKFEKEREPGPIATAFAVIVLIGMVAFGLALLAGFFHEAAKRSGGSHTSICNDAYDPSYDCTWLLDEDY